MGKPGIKDPEPTLSKRILSAVLSKPPLAVIGGTIGYRKLPETLKDIGVIGKLESLLKVTLSGQQEDVIAGILAGLLGLGIGVGVQSAGAWIRLRIIKSLLAYHGWLFNTKARSTMVWGMLLKLLVGPGPHGTFEFQPVMPKLPVPSLDESCNRYLRVLKPLLSKEEYEKNEIYVQELLNGDGKVLQQYLKQRDKKMESWLADYWIESAYLSRRASVAIDVNFYMSSKYMEDLPCQPIARTATCLYNAMKYHDMIRLNKLPPDLVLDTIPLCMDGARFLFSSCRIPGEDIDRLERYPDSTHAVVNSKGVYYRVEIYHKDEKGHLSLLSKRELKNQLEYIVNDTKDIDVSKKNAVAVLTTQDRSVWAKHREMLMSNPVNAATLRDVESAIFFQIIGDETPDDISDMVRALMTGDGTTRWFDKSHTLEIFKDTTMGGSNMEHSGADATHFAVMWEHVLQMEHYTPNGDIIDSEEEILGDFQPPKRLEWQLDYMQDIINKALQEYRSRIADFDIIATHTDYGKRYMKTKKVSPDGYLQMAIQLAFWRMHKTITKTYEPASTRLFKFGRTDNINPISEESIKWVQMMDDGKSSRSDIIRMMQAAIRYQSDARLEATAGFGCERHLLGLSMAAKELEMKQPKLFTDEAFHLPMRLSTSQVPTNLGNYGINCVPESLLGGFGPGCHDGYGILYCQMGDDMFNVSISSWKSCGETNSAKFGDVFHTAMADMRHLMDGTGKYVESQGNEE